MVKEETPAHVEIRRYLKDGFLSRSDLIKKFGKIYPSKGKKEIERLVDTTLNRMIKWKEVKKLGKGKYADYSYIGVSEQEIIDEIKYHAMSHRRQLPSINELCNTLGLDYQVEAIRNMCSKCLLIAKKEISEESKERDAKLLSEVIVYNPSDDEQKEMAKKFIKKP